MVLKKIMAVLLAAVGLCMSLSVSVSAEAIYPFIDSVVSPAYVIANNPVSKLNISGKTAYCTSTTDGANAVSITVEQTLEKYSGWLWMWDDVDGARWTKTVNIKTISVSNIKSELSSGTYRLKSIFTLTSLDGKSETITVYSEEKTIL